MIFIVKDTLKVLSRIKNQSRSRWIHSVMSMVESKIDIDDNHGLDDDDDDDDDDDGDDDDDDDDDEAKDVKDVKDAKDVSPPAFTVATKYFPR